jgi:GT2 family glycosyltransferase
LKTAVVVPTLGARIGLLEQSLRSIRQSGNVHICVVAPGNFDYSGLKAAGLLDQFVIDPMEGLPNAINRAFSEVPKSVRYISWLGDDDLLKVDSIELVEKVLDSNEHINFVYGYCEYIDIHNRVIAINKSGKIARLILRFGPCLIPQPGSLIRRSAFDQIGGLNTGYKLAFDFDLFLNLNKNGKLKSVPFTLSSFRWHSDSLSVSSRLASVNEASRTRIEHLPSHVKSFAPIWEYPIKKMTYYAGIILNKRVILD